MLFPIRLVLSALNAEKVGLRIVSSTRVMRNIESIKPFVREFFRSYITRPFNALLTTFRMEIAPAPRPGGDDLRRSERRCKFWMVSEYERAFGLMPRHARRTIGCDNFSLFIAPFASVDVIGERQRDGFQRRRVLRRRRLGRSRRCVDRRS